MKVEPGTLPVGVRWLIAAACGVTVLLAYYGMLSIWELGGYAVRDRSSFWYTNGVALGVGAALLALFAPRWRLSRFVRVAVLLPVVHVACILIAWRGWIALRDTVLDAGYSSDISRFYLPPLSVAIVGPLLLIAAIAIKRRRGEWAHAFVMLSLAFLLLVGLWLPFVSAWGSGEIEVRYHDYRYYGETEPAMYWVQHLSTLKFLLVALVVPGITAIAFTALAMRKREFWIRNRARIAVFVKALVPLSAFMLCAQTDEGAVLYLGFSYLILLAAMIAIAAIVVLAFTTWGRYRVAMYRLRTRPHHKGTIVGDDSAAAYEITSWLRGPRLANRPFVIATEHGDLPIAGAEIVTPIPARTTALGVGDHADVLAPGTRVVIAGAKASADGHPFRNLDAAQVELVAAEGVTRYRFSDVALVVWRPAVAYLAIALAVAIPAVAMLLTA